jgi:CRISPR-associated protein Csx10
MKRIQITITAKSPLAIARQKTGGSISDVESYIPGGVLRGAIAGLMIRQAQAEGQDFANDPDSDFKTLFIDNQVIFQNAYPAIIEVKDKLRIQHDICVMPSTALSSKNSSGFEQAKKNGVFDTLIDRFCADAYNQIYDPNCPQDGDRVDPFKGLYSIYAGEYYTHSASTRLLTRIGINRRRATAEDKVLYSVQVLNETKQHQGKIADMTFVGNIWICDELADSFNAYLQGQSQHCRLGGSASRGLGKVELKPERIEATSGLNNRIQSFNQTLKARWESWKIFGGQPVESIEGRCFFTLDLQSDAILTEQWQRTMVISEAMLKEAVGLTSGNLKLHQAFSSYGFRSGWNTAWGLPKDVELTTDRGSVYLFSIDAKEQASWASKLEELEIWGIGDATAEGFGQVRVCDEFHTVLRENAK